MIPYDCIIHGIIKYISSSEDYLKLFTLSKDIYQLVMNSEYECHICFNTSYYPVYSDIKKLKYGFNIVLPLSVKKIIFYDNMILNITRKYAKRYISDGTTTYKIPTIYNRNFYKEDDYLLDNIIYSEKKNTDIFNKKYYEFISSIFPFVKGRELLIKNLYNAGKSFIDVFSDFIISTGSWSQSTR